jgi:hypothetical protein
MRGWTAAFGPMQHRCAGAIGRELTRSRRWRPCNCRQVLALVRLSAYPPTGSQAGETDTLFMNAGDEQAWGKPWASEIAHPRRVRKTTAVRTTASMGSALHRRAQPGGITPRRGRPSARRERSKRERRMRVFHENGAFRFHGGHGGSITWRRFARL